MMRPSVKNKIIAGFLWGPTFVYLLYLTVIYNPDEASLGSCLILLAFFTIIVGIPALLGKFIGSWIDNLLGLKTRLEIVLAVILIAVGYLIAAWILRWIVGQSI